MSMYRIARVVKPHRITPVKPHPFGAGLLASRPVFFADHTIADESWNLEHVVAAEFSGSEGWLDSRELEERARQAEFDRRWEAAVATGDICAMCGRSAPGELVCGLCDGCNAVLDRDGDFDPDNGGTCANCDTPSDYRDEHDLCPPCATIAEDMSASGNRGR